MERSEANRTTLELANAAVRDGDHEGFLAQCTDDTEWTFVGDRVLRGKAAVRRWMTDTYRQPPRFVVHEMIATADTVVALGEITVADDTGRDVTSSYCDVWHLRDGKLAELRAYVIERSASTSS